MRMDPVRGCTDATVFLRAIARHADAELRYRALNPCDVCPSDAAHQRLPLSLVAHSWLIAANTQALLDGVD
jgi:hypothetical protein